MSSAKTPRRSLIAAVLASGVVAAAGVPALGATLPPSPGAPGAGDRLYPGLGNGGYDVKHYDLSLRYANATNASPATGTIAMTAKATQALSRFNIDYSGGAFATLTVNGVAATYTRTAQEIVVTPSRPLELGATFTVVVGRFTATPTEPDGSTAAGTAFFVTDDGSATAGQADGMHAMYPSSDHPGDKASFTFTLDAPSSRTAVANGVLTSKEVTGARTVWIYQQAAPMATELTQIAVGAFTVVPRGKVGDVVVRDLVPTKDLAKYTPLLGVEKSQLEYMVGKVGPYPFPVYGSFPINADLGFALETQTLSIFDPGLFDRSEGVWKPVMTHELAHQWFGDSVAPTRWSDIWNNEGHATWYEWNYAADNGWLDEDAGVADFTQLMKNVYADGDQARKDHGPVGLPLSGSVDDLFSSQSYDGGALVLYALRQKVGAATFEKIERTWAQGFRGRSASTQDYILTASAVSGQNLAPFLNSWIYGTKTPPMPGHPDWTVNPVTTSASSLKSLSAPFALRR